MIWDKRQSKCTNGCPAFIRKGKIYERRSVEVQKVVFPFLKQNGYFFHHEKIMFSLISYSRPNILQLAWRKIKNTCSTRKSQSNRLRVFKIPEIIVVCGIDYINIGIWKNIELNETQNTTNVTESETASFILDKTELESRTSIYFCEWCLFWSLWPRF